MTATAADRISGQEDLEVLFDFGTVPIGGVYWRTPAAQSHLTAPLVLCRARASGLVQLRDRYDAGLYAQYTFAPAGASTYQDHVRSVGAWLAAMLARGTEVFEIGASDGTLLAALQGLGMRASGVEPSQELVAKAGAAGLEVECGYVSASWARAHVARRRPYGAVVMRHVLEHLDQPGDMLDAIDALLADDGVLLLEMPAWEGIVAQRAFSSIFHEHVAYYSGEVLWRLLAGRGWAVTGYRAVPVHGQSHLLICRRGAAALPPPAAPSAADERAFLGEVAAYQHAFRRLVAAELAAGRSLAGYGASHRTAGLLAMGGLVDGGLTAIYDQNPLLHGRYQPPCGTPIRDPQALPGDAPDTVIVFAISYTDEVVARLDGLRRRGGSIIRLDGPLPRLVTGRA